MRIKVTEKSIHGGAGTKLAAKPVEKNYRSLWLFIGLLLLTASVFLVPGLHMDSLIQQGKLAGDIIRHTLFYLLFTLILFELISIQERSLSFFFFLIFFSALFEILQAILYDIAFSWHDVAANTLGISLAFGIAHLRRLHRRRKRRLRRMSHPPEN